MNSPASIEPLVEALEMRLRLVDLVAWSQITARAEKLGLSFEDLRLLLALSTCDGATSVSDLARLSGLSLETAYPTANRLRRRGYLHEDRRRYSLSEDGRELAATLDAAHREGVKTYVDGLDDRERQLLDDAIRGAL